MNTPNQHFVIQCYVGSTLAEVADYSLAFSADSPARATLTLKGSVAVNSLIAVELGWGNSVHRCFTGFVERVAPDVSGYTKVFCRELSAILYRDLNVCLRQPTLHQVLSNVTAKSGIQFVLPDKEYTATAIPCYYSVGNGYYLLDHLGTAFNIPDFIWQQQGNGQVYVGSWSDSRWGTSGVSIPSQLLTPTASPKTFSVPCMPQLKPHAQVNGARLYSVSHSQTESVLTWM